MARKKRTKRASEKTPYTKENEERKSFIHFIWYQGKDGPYTGIGRTCEVWSKGMIIETARDLSAGSQITIDVHPHTNLPAYTGKILLCKRTKDKYYRSELEFPVKSSQG